MTSGMINVAYAEPAPTAGVRCTVLIRPISDLAAEERAKWRSLADRALDPNPFHDPRFVLPLVRHVVGEPDVNLAILRLPDASWTGVAAIHRCRPTIRRPFPYFRSLSSPYTFLDQFLVDRENPQPAFDALFEFLSSQEQFDGLRFRTMKADSLQMQSLNRAAETYGLVRFEDRTWNRPELVFSETSPESLLSQLSKSRRKSLMRSRRWLESQGRLQFRLMRPEWGESSTVDEFLRLESLGWKGVRRTAISSRLSDERFFREMASAFATRGDIIFGEFLLDGRVIASTCNLRAGNVLFAFKIGWDPAFSKGALGYWSEYELASTIRKVIPGIERIDSCAAENSYTAAMYPGACRMSSVVYAWSRRAIALCEARRQYQIIKQRLRG